MARKWGNKRPAGRTRRRVGHAQRERREWGGNQRRGWLVGRMMLQEGTGAYEHEWLLIECPTMADASAMADVMQAERKAKVVSARMIKGEKPPTFYNPAMPPERKQ